MVKSQITGPEPCRMEEGRFGRVRPPSRKQAKRHSDTQCGVNSKRLHIGCEALSKRRAGKNSPCRLGNRLRRFRYVLCVAERLHCEDKDNMNPHTVLWIYIVLLLAGGLIGFLKAGSKVSLITSAVSAAALIVTTIPGLLGPALARGAADVIMAALLFVFAIRLGKTKKFMPSGLMLVITALALAFRHLYL